MNYLFNFLFCMKYNVFFYLFCLFFINIFFQSQIYNNNTFLKLKKVKFKKKLSAEEKTDSIITLYNKDPIFKNAKWGFCVYNPKTKKIIISKDRCRSYIPASTMKLITTETALSLLGENFRWKTQINYSGFIDEYKNLNGNLYLITNNDPTLGYKKINIFPTSNFFNIITHKIREKGIKKINGNIIIEFVLFKSDLLFLKKILKNHYGNYYSILNNINNNFNFQNFINQKNNNVFFCNKNKKTEKNKFENAYLVNDIPSSIFLFIKKLKRYLDKNQKLKFNGQIYLQKKNIINNFFLNTKKIYTYQSPALKDIVYFINQTSNNYFAEQLLNSLGYLMGKKPIRKTGINLVIKYLHTQNLDLHGFSYTDGSGLSRSNYITPIAQVKYLSNIMNKPFFHIFFKSLPKAGETGTLKNMFVNSIAIGKLRAKTGTLSNVKALTGYLDTRSGNRLCFSLLVNNFSGNTEIIKKRIEKLIESVIDY